MYDHDSIVYYRQFNADIMVYFQSTFLDPDLIQI